LAPVMVEIFGALRQDQIIAVFAFLEWHEYRRQSMAGMREIFGLAPLQNRGDFVGDHDEESLDRLAIYDMKPFQSSESTAKRPAL